MRFVYKQNSNWDHPVDPERCEATVAERGRGVKCYQCRRKWKVEEDGHRWCQQHAPSAEKAREDDSMAKYRADQERRARAQKRQAILAVVHLLREVGDEDLADSVSTVLLAARGD